MSGFPRLGALAVLIREGEVLLAQRKKASDHGLWGYPGGHVEPGESALDAAVRELREETGVEARARCYLTNVDVIRHDADGALLTHYLLAAVLCDHVSGEARAVSEIADARWFPFDQVMRGALPMSEGVGRVLTSARAALS